jgi:acyl-CoA thioester hydrolase
MTAANFREVRRRVVTEDMCDALGHMNIQHYFETLSDGVFEIMAILGEPIEEIEERRTAFALHKEESQFSEELHPGDEFYMATAIEHIGTKSMILQHRFFSAEDDRELFRSRFITVNMDLNNRSSLPFSDDFKALAAKEFPIFTPED